MQICVLANQITAFCFCNISRFHVPNTANDTIFLHIFINSNNYCILVYFTDQVYMLSKTDVKPIWWACIRSNTVS